MRNLHKKGVTLLELLVVIAVMGLIFLVVLPQFSKSRENAVMKSAVADILSSVNKARSRTLASLNSSEYGVHFQSDKVIIFKGKVFSAVDVNNETISIATPANISNVTFGGVSSSSGDLYFNRVFGVPNTTGTVTVSTPSSSKVITIYATGVASSN